MKIVSFNVNSIRARMPSLQYLIETQAPDIIGLQETKVADEMFPVEEVESLGYKVYFHGQKAHHGVAIMSKIEAEKIIKGMPNDTEDMQKRMITAEFKTPDGENLHLINSYFPQGENRSHPEKFPYKQKFYADLLDFLNSEFSQKKRVALMGDFNVALEDIDIGIGETNRQRWLKTGKTCFLPEERQWLQKIMDWGFFDTWREQNPTEDKLFTWFDYRSKGFEDSPKRGLRIDMILATENLQKKLKTTAIDYDTRSLERPSDHCPIIAEFKF